MAVCFIISFPSHAVSDNLKKILVLHSYHQGLVWTDDIMEGIYSVFDKYDPDLEIHVEYMDTKRYFDGFNGRFLTGLRDMYKNKYGEMQLDMIISSDDNAFQFLLKYHDELFPGTPIVFCGVNDFEDRMLAGHEFVTGVIELLDQKASIDTAIRLHPNAREIFIITDTSISGQINRKIIKELAEEYRGKVDFVFIDTDNTGLTLEELTRRLSLLKQNSVVFYSDFLRIRDKYIIQETAVPRISRASRNPIYTHYDEILGLGVVGGKLVNGNSHGQQAAQMALRILQGTPVNTIPVHKESINTYMFDYEELTRFHINEKNLPEGSIVINRPHSFYSAHKAVVWTVTGVFAFLFLSLAVISANVIRRKKAEVELIRAHDQLEVKVEERTNALSTANLELKSEIDERKLAEENLKRSTDMLTAIKDAQEHFITGSDHDRIFKDLLETLVSMTDSEYGFLDEVLQNKNGKWYKRCLSISNIAWDEDSRKLYEELEKSNFEFHNLDNLSGEPVKTGNLVISDDPPHDPRSGGLPEGHPRINSYMGIPMYFGGELVGVAAVANREGGYTEEISSSLAPFISTCASIIAAIRSEKAENKFVEKLRKSEKQLSESHERLLTVLDSLNAIVYVADMETYEVLFINKFTREVFGDIEGKLCWQSLQTGKSGPCEFCTNNQLLTSEGEPAGVYVWEFQNTVNERWYLINDRAIRWVDGRTVRMEIATDITERKQAEEQIRNSLKEKELLLQEVHHRVKNNMTVVHSLLELQSKHIHDERDGEMFRESMNRIKSMAMIHEKLYQAKDLANIDFSAYLKHMINNIFMSYGLTYDQVMLKVDVKDVTLGIDAAIPCGLIINELVSNSLKHAFPENMKGEVIVALIENDKNAFELTVRDNGIGIPDSIDVRAADTLGINLVTALVNQLQGTLEMKREQGTEFHIIFRRQ
jgi:two-component sensor histidine kinase/ABC-type uncharacterized transport system substrate-binding protein